MTAADKKNRRYHHGDLRNALIVAAAELIEEGGCDDFALVDAARRAGVSSAAPYRHFRDREDLLQAVVELASWELSCRTRKVLAEHPRGSRECILALGKCYVSFVTDHGAFYDLLWGDSSNRRQGSQPPPTGKREGFGLFLSAVAAWCDGSAVTEQDPLDLSLKLWALAHGLAGLAMHHQFDLIDASPDIDELLASAGNSLLDGVELARDHTKR